MVQVLFTARMQVAGLYAPVAGLFKILTSGCGSVAGVKKKHIFLSSYNAFEIVCSAPVLMLAKLSSNLFEGERHKNQP